MVNSATLLTLRTVLSLATSQKSLVLPLGWYLPCLHSTEIIQRVSDLLKLKTGEELVNYSL